jgi:hypothetical protein
MSIGLTVISTIIIVYIVVIIYEKLQKKTK